ncbi:MAG TPA: MBL fold metallo-hydrolase, partial [Steroidobacteraceae bacterium]|nr:MBL fold metallo-hydrolase [Steroidobacteraceae bacterium]
GVAMFIRVACVLLCMLSVTARAQDPDVDVRAEAVATGVWVLYGSGGNIGVSAGPDGVFLIDDQYAVMTPKISEALAKIAPEPPRFVLNTHWHGDHTGGNENLAEKGSLIVAHDNVRQRMSTEQFNKFLDRATPASPAKALPVVTFNDSVSFFLNGDEIRGVHVAHAHTDGDVFIHIRKANVIHTGDLVFAGRYPFIDLDSGGSVDGVVAAVDRMIALADDRTRVIPGHGDVTDKAGLAAYREMLVTTSRRVRELAKAGQSVDEVLAAKPNADYDEKLTWGFITPERYVRILYRDATESGAVK